MACAGGGLRGYLRRPLSFCEVESLPCQPSSLSETFQALINCRPTSFARFPPNQMRWLPAWTCPTNGSPATSPETNFIASMRLQALKTSNDTQNSADFQRIRSLKYLRSSDLKPPHRRSRRSITYLKPINWHSSSLVLPTMDAFFTADPAGCCCNTGLAGYCRLSGVLTISTTCWGKADIATAPWKRGQPVVQFVTPSFMVRSPSPVAGGPARDCIGEDKLQTWCLIVGFGMFGRGDFGTCSSLSRLWATVGETRSDVAGC